MDNPLFRPLPPRERAELDAAFVAYALERDGQPDPVARRLARREAFFADLEARGRPRWTAAPPDPGQFAEFHLGRRPLSEAPPLLRWLVRVARANEGEGWGVDYLLDRGGFDGLGRGGRSLRPRDFADLEETYHTRILREVVRAFGLDFELRTPPLPIRASVGLMARLPRSLSYVLLAAGELMGTIAFLRMAETGEHLLREVPDLQAWVRALLDEILVDEIGHVTYLLGTMGAWQLAAVRRLALAYQSVSSRGYHGDDRQETGALRAGIRDYRLERFPLRVLERAFLPASYRAAVLRAASAGQGAP